MNSNDAVLTGTKESPMRDILHKTTGILKGRGKVITLREHVDEKECITDVRKNFIYLTSEAQSEETQSIPQVHIAKSFDSVRRDEKFSFPGKRVLLRQSQQAPDEGRLLPYVEDQFALEE